MKKKQTEKKPIIQHLHNQLLKNPSPMHLSFKLQAMNTQPQTFTRIAHHLIIFLNLCLVNILVELTQYNNKGNAKSSARAWDTARC